MLIKSITLNNFRQFKGKQSLEFSTDKHNNVTVLLGDNTFGKTTILQAFNWCLYGKADFPQDSNPEFLLNYEISTGSTGALSNKCEVYVELVIEHEGMEYSIRRKQDYVDRGRNDWTSLQAKLSVFYKKDGISKQVREGDDQNIINSILPQSLSGYFFFDTERVSDISSRKDLTEAVRGLLGLAPVSNARKHLGSRTTKTTVIGQWNASLDSGGDDRAREAQEIIDNETNRKETLENTIQNIETELSDLNTHKEEIAEVLRKNQDTAELQQKKQMLEGKLEKEKEELDECNGLFLDQYCNNAATFFMLPLIDQAEACLVDANLYDKGIRDMTGASIQDIISRGRCICGAEIVVADNGKKGNSAYEHIMEEMHYLPPIHIGPAILSFKELVATERRSMDQFYQKFEHDYKVILKHRNSIYSLEDEIDRIEKSIFDKENMADYEADLNRIKESIKRLTEKKANLNKEIGACESAIASAQKTYDSLVTTSERNERLITYIAYAEKICDWIDASYAEKEQEMRDKLQDKVNGIFSKMYHGQRKVQIDKQFNVTLLSNINDKEINTGESEGLKRVKNFAFIAGLVDIAKDKASMGNKGSDSISWENEPYPLVMDAPFSNADERHIKNISSVLPLVANQVIMFVMEKDWQYAQPVMNERVGKYCSLKKHSETFTEIVK